MPRKVQDLALMAQKAVTQVLGVEPDFTPETLPLIDRYLRDLSPDMPPDVRHLVVSTVGCYFGEVVRRVLKGRWCIDGDGPEAWRIELSSCFLHFSPVGMAGEVASLGEDESYDGSFSTLDDLHDGLSDALGTAAPLPEDEYYSLSGRVDILQLAADWLVGRAMASGRDRPSFTAADYKRHLQS